MGAPLWLRLHVMNTEQIQTFLQGVNLLHFSQEYKVPLRTLTRIRTGDGTQRQATLDMIAKAVKKAQRKAEKAAV